ncbi:hypothetical protein J6590_052212 [Homalodisca vitripennis]|nr:hypothetical protein J6590_052212 [Homalodisca vitripennis]
MGTRGVQVYTVRFLPGQELKSGLEHFVKQRQLQAAFIMTCVGSVQSATLRFATPAGENTSKTEMVRILFITNVIKIIGSYVIRGRFENIIKLVVLEAYVVVNPYDSNEPACHIPL